MTHKFGVMNFTDMCSIKGEAVFFWKLFATVNRMDKWAADIIKKHIYI